MMATSDNSTLLRVFIPDDVKMINLLIAFQFTLENLQCLTLTTLKLRFTKQTCKLVSISMQDKY